MNRPFEHAPLPIPEGPDRLSPETFETLGVQILNRTKRLQERMGSRGARRLGQLNQYGEDPILADRAVERLVILDLAASGIRFHGKSEEHGDFYTYDGFFHDKPSDDPAKQPEAFANLDGEDGSKAAGAYLLGSNDRLDTRFGTMLSFAPTPNPRLKDFTFAATLEHAYETDYVHKKRKNLSDEDREAVREAKPESVGRLVYATKGKGTFVQTPFELRQLHAPQVEDVELGPDTPIHYLEYDYFNEMPSKEKEIEAFLKRNKIPAVKTLATASHFIDLIAGADVPPYAIAQPGRDLNVRYRDIAETDVSKTIVAVAEPERKGLEELGVTYLQVKEAGGVVRTLVEGVPVDVGDMPFIPLAEKWHRQPVLDRQPIVAAVNADIADQLLLAS